ncbi:MAG: hypothetical protein ACREGB_03635, partial [Candidatus Saccharimonadales bacterium]
ARQMTYRPQRTHGFFLNSADSDKKEFLTTLLGLQEIEQGNEQFDIELTGLKTTRSNAASQLEYAKTNKALYAVRDEDMQAAKTQYEQAQQRVQALIGNTEEAALLQQKLLVEEEIRKTNVVSSQVQAAKNDNVNLRNNMIQLQAEIKSLEDQKCHACLREWKNSATVLATKTQTYKEKYAKMEANLAVIANAESILANAPQLAAKQQEIISRMGQLRAPVADANNALQAAGNALRGMTDKQNAFNKLGTDIDVLTKRIAQLDSDIVVLQHAADISGRNGFLGDYFTQILTEIEAKANKMIARIPNVSRFTLKISPNTVGKTTGKVKKEIKVMIYKDGKEVAFKAISGGQQCSLELFTDLAAIKTVQRRSGSPISWISLDEAMEGLEPENKQAALEVIRTEFSGLFLVIDHSTEIKEGFEKVIHVEYDGRYSSVVRQ